MKEEKHATKCRATCNCTLLGNIKNCPFGNHECECDGYHTFDELYAHRIEIFIALCKYFAWTELEGGSENTVWRSKYHSDGELAFDGKWFVLGIGKKAGEQITYHLPINRWDDTDDFETLDKAPEWDGHTSADVLERLKAL